MNEIKFDKEIEIAIKAAQTAGRYLKEEKKKFKFKDK